MKFFKSFLIILFAVSFVKLQAQDIHFTMFDRSPLTLNPANTGAFQGSYRIGGIYRKQWPEYGNFTTPSIAIDGPVVMGLGKNDWIGVGVMVFQDNRGTVGLKDVKFGVSASYHLAIDKKARNIVTLGLQAGFDKRSISDKDAEWGGQGNDETLVPSKDAKSVFDLGAGLLFTSKISEGTVFTLGFSGFHLNKPEYQLLTQSARSKKMAMRFNGHIGLDYKMNDKWSLEPSIMYQQMEKNDAIVVQSWAGYLFNAEKELTLKFGAGYRLNDGGTVQALLGADYKSWKVGLAYDLELSNLKPKNAFEIGLSYIGKIYKKPAVPSVILCPRL